MLVSKTVKMKRRKELSMSLSFLFMLTACSTAPSPQQAPWELIQEAPIQGREGHSIVWTGEEIIVWGGRAGSDLADGAAYDPQTRTWRLIATPAGFPGSYGHTAVWTGEGMLVTQGPDMADTGSDSMIYFPSSDTWRATSPAPDITGVVSRFAFDGDAVILSEEAVYSYDPDTDTWAQADTRFPVRDGALMETGEVAFVGFDEGGGLRVGAVDPRSGTYRRMPTRGVDEGPWERSSLVSSGQGKLWLVLSRGATDPSVVYSLEDGDSAWSLEYEDASLYLQASGIGGGIADSVLLEWFQGNLVSVRAGAIGVYDTDTGQLAAYQVDNDAAPCLLGDYSVIADDQLMSWSGPSCRNDAPLSYPTEGLIVALAN
ncbi:hypothetical protein ACQEU5_21555 [Marinactinospora thermotolerans]|uniref:hypothetical protein n=1 Tax=Marinactinospora thermotolerans TaxID=531310 RepID=UPI003D908F40